MFGIGGFEFLLILLFAFLVFGPDKLPEIARTAGELIGRFRQAQEEMNSVVRNELLDDKNQKRKTQPSSTRRNATAKPTPGADEEEDALSKVSSKVIDAVDAVTESAKEAAHEQRVEQSQAKESFSERKARYERERQEANRRAMKEQAAEAPEPESRPSAAELYGTKPMKPAPKAAAATQPKPAAEGSASEPDSSADQSAHVSEEGDN